METVPVVASFTPTGGRDGNTGHSDEIYRLLSVIFAGSGLILAILAHPVLKFGCNKLRIAFQSKRTEGDVELGIPQGDAGL